ncbi:acyl-CoA synthetase [Vibrio sp. Isolate25]|uniref:acyl-CoA synthetase n=1 Tax=Vibrio TaxID=662 RepID=UPI001EFD9E81|nr:MULTISPECIES: acyl-CoA synthetase [Vibrio]MCG9596196.1 acyl-CoA synthetase [Vibrio sp. Isolate25]USD34916.1 acyl-CoA synthetase [Vibrio sp. SCSIO 43186]USD47981.1 acyl-CoA synthetase [Vibrio sp. SCSIO 43145]USD72040.1 acyl-CoA synthetase [Vibrio sp. SCSIO 43139]USD97710.1 acyl-CoA synthetase [Vibrio coralliilyticus]
MNLIVNINRHVREYGFEMATRQAWRCGVKANLVQRIIGVAKGQVVCVIEGVRAELSTPMNNPLHHEEIQGRYIFVGGIVWQPNDILAPAFPEFMFMHLRNISNKHKYMTDEQLQVNLA